MVAGTALSNLLGLEVLDQWKEETHDPLCIELTEGLIREAWEWVTHNPGYRSKQPQTDREAVEMFLDGTEQ